MLVVLLPPSTQVVGISSMKALTADGVSFAIPIDTAKHVVSQVGHMEVVPLNLLASLAALSIKCESRTSSLPCASLSSLQM